MLDHARAYYLERRLPALSLSSSRRRGSYRAMCDSVKVWKQAGRQQRGAILRTTAKATITAAVTASSSIAIPSRAATFFTPIELTPKALDGCENVYVDHAERPSVLLAPCAPLAELSLSRTSSLLEMHRFGVGEMLDAMQARESVFVLERDGLLNGLGVFIWVDLGIGGPSPASATTTDAAAAASASAGGGDGSLLGSFPFGDASLLLSPSPPSPLLNDFTSLCTPETVSLCTHATNWMNPLLLLPRPVQVKRGERLRVRSIARAGSERPSYRFDLALLRLSGREEEEEVALGSVEVGLEQLYPDYGV